MVERKGLQASTENYIKAVGTMTAITEHIMGIPLNSDTMRQWDAYMRFIRLGDDRLDSIAHAQQRRAFSEGVMGYLRGETEVLPFDDPPLYHAITQVRSLEPGIDEPKRETVYAVLEQILEVTEAIRHSLNARELSSLTRLEGELTAVIFINLLPEKFKDSRHYPRLVRTLRGLGSFGNSFDTAFDLSDDFNSGEVQVSPTLQNRAALLIRGAPDALRAVISMRPTASLVKQMSSDIRGTMQNNSRKDLL